MTTIATKQVPIGLFFCFIAIGLNIFINARRAGICERHPQHRAIAIKPMPYRSATPSQSGRTIAIEGSA